jgi:tetratricopeptide (TPR) repeat protein
VRCGTRLMLIVEPPATRFEIHGRTAAHEEHLLERVSALENVLKRMIARLEHGMEMLLRYARNSYFDRLLVETLVGVLSEAGTVDVDSLHKAWGERCRKDAIEQDEQERREQLRVEIIARYQGAGKKTFAGYINEGMDKLGEKETARGLRLLERAAAMSAGIAPLLSFIGEHFFREGKMTLARDYLARALEAEPEDHRVCLLLGLACGDEGEAERAKKLLSDAARRGGASFAAHYGLGRLLAAEQIWTAALAEFKRALAARPSPEAHYVVGCVCYQLGRNRMAARHLRKAVEMDERYAAAYYMLGLALMREGQQERASEAFSAARAAGQDEPRYRQTGGRRKRQDDAAVAALLFGGAARQSGKRLVTSGDKRLASVVREDALSISRAGEDEG